MAEIAPLGFTLSRQVSKYIIANRLGNKYRNISGVVEMAKDGDTWKFNGGFPPKIYAELCAELGLDNQGTRQRAVGFQSFGNWKEIANPHMCFCSRDRREMKQADRGIVRMGRFMQGHG